MSTKVKSANPWEVAEFVTDEKQWADKSATEKALFLFIQSLKTLLMLCLLYLFIVSLSLMANSFRILGGKESGRTFRDTELFNNPIAGLVAGILVTVLVQSSSTSTSIIITMTAGELIKIENAIPMIMGANIGTSVTNTIVSLGHMGDKDEYRRAFAGATVHDMFNLLNVMVFLPIEFITGMLRHIAGALVDGMDITDDEDKEAKTAILKAIVSPVNNRILAIDKKMITSIAKANSEDVAKYDDVSIIKHGQKDDNHLFMDTPMSDGVAGALMVLVSLGFLCLCLILMVKVLQSIFRGRVAIWTRKMVNLEIDAVPGLANYILICGGAILTVIFQSSSVTTSTLTPLVGIGLIRMEKMFAFTMGANVGTCITGILSALVTDKRKTALTVAFSHLLFNFLGMLVWYPLPLLRNVPIAMAKLNGNMAADLAWWPWAYIVVVFLVIPFVLLAISAVSPWLLVALFFPVFFMCILGAVVVTLRFNNPSRLPARFQSDHRLLPQSLCIADRAEVASSSSLAFPGSSSTTSTSNADIGKDDWRYAPVAWGAGWFVIMALLVGLTNAKWADLKYPSFDGRDHVGFSAWESCSYGYKDNDVVWAKPYDLSKCTSTYLSTCATSDVMTKCSTVSFSNIPDINKEYEKSWTACREVCPMFKWSQWCDAQACGGTLHKLQCQNVTDAVMRPYVVNYGPSPVVGSADKTHAWKKGDRCRALSDVCDNSESIKVGGDVGVVALVCAIIGHVAVMTYNSMQKKRDMKMMLIFSLGSWCLTWLFCFVAWLCFFTASQEEATCVVEDVSGNGAVLAKGAFKDIASSSYTFGCVLGSWILSLVAIFAILARLSTAPKFGAAQGRQIGDIGSPKSESVAVPVVEPVVEAVAEANQPAVSVEI